MLPTNSLKGDNFLWLQEPYFYLSIGNLPFGTSNMIYSSIAMPKDPRYVNRHSLKRNQEGPINNEKMTNLGKMQIKNNRILFQFTK